MSSFTDALAWLEQHHDSLEVAFWLIGLLAVGFAGMQLSEARKQRGLTESFELVQKLNTSLDAWRIEAERTPNNAADFGRRLADVLTNVEIICDGINRGYLSRMSREILTNQILGNLRNLYEDQRTHAAHRFLCDDPSVCASFQIFLLNHHRRLRRYDPEHAAFDAIFSNGDRRLLDQTVLSFLERRVNVIRLNIWSRQ